MSTAIQVVEKIIEDGFHGKIPPPELDVRFIYACIEQFASNVSPLLQHHFAAEISMALFYLRASKCRWIT